VKVYLFVEARHGIKTEVKNAPLPNCLVQLLIHISSGVVNNCIRTKALNELGISSAADGRHLICGVWELENCFV
jgi:hypothetical protein